MDERLDDEPNDHQVELADKMLAVVNGETAIDASLAFGVALAEFLMATTDGSTGDARMLLRAMATDIDGSLAEYSNLPDGAMTLQ